MATFKIVVQKQRADGCWPVYIRVTHNRKIKYIITDKVVTSKGIYKKNHEVKDPYVIQFCSSKITQFIEILNKKNISKWSVEEIVEYLKSGYSDICFSDYARKYYDNLYNNGHERNAKNYALSYQHLERFAGTDKVMFSQLTTHFIMNWMKTLEKTARAKEMYPVCVRQIFKQALLDYNDYDNGVIRITTNPWVKVTIPKSDTPEKRAITMEKCRAFFSAPLPPSDRLYPLPELGRDVAMMVLCLAGINTVDIYNLQKSNLKNGIISYERAKTRNHRRDRAYIEMEVPGLLEPVMEKYLDKSDSDYLFNFHNRMTNSDSFNANVNIGIRQICEKSLGLSHEQTYSAYTFRHTWATVAQNECGASMAEIGFAMNHSDRMRVTRTYVKIDFSPAWKLNEKVLEKIFFTNEKSHEHQDQEKTFERFSIKQLIKGQLYFNGTKLVEIEDIGFNNVDEVIDALMSKMPTTIPERSLVQIKIENKDKNQTQEYSRMVRK